MEEPKTISRYRLTGELGRGGMGVVYEAEDPQLGRPVAIKVILFPEGATDNVRNQLEQRFEREARSAASIHHPGVVTVHDFGRDGDYLFLVMELVAGTSLADKLKSGWLPERAQAFEIAAKVADGLAAAHAAGVVHRDVTPRNILMADDGSPSKGGQVGRIVVTDFGIARSIGEETYELTRTGMLVGSPSFMAPEQVRNKDLDERADIFSLGVVLYLLLTGKLPFQSNDLTSLLYQIVHEDPFDAKVTAKLGAATVAFLRRSLAKDAADRVPEAADFAREARRLKQAAQTAELEETVALGALDRKPGEQPPKRHGWTPLALALIAAAVAGAWVLIRVLGGVDPRPADAVARAPEPAPVVADAPVSEDSSPTSEPIPAGDEPRANEVATTVPVAEESEPPPPAPRAAVQPAPTPAAPPPPTVDPPPAAVEPAATLAATPQPSEPLPSPDMVAPVLDIDDMPLELTATEVVLSGRVMDDRGGAVELTVDDERVPVEADGAFLARRPLSPGRNSLAFVAVDDAGNRTMKSVDVTGGGATPAAGGGASNVRAAGPATAHLPGRPAARPRFADRGDGTMVDTLTGITWTKRVEPSDGWKASKSYCKKLEMGRQRDWMLPTIEELEELYRSGAGALSFPAGMIWSQTKNGSGQAWAFDFIAGRRAGQPVAGAAGLDFKAFCLRRVRPRGNLQSAPDPSPFGQGGLGDSGANPPPPRGGGPPPRGGGRSGGGG